MICLGFKVKGVVTSVGRNYGFLKWGVERVYFSITECLDDELIPGDEVEFYIFSNADKKLYAKEVRLAEKEEGPPRCGLSAKVFDDDEEK